MKLNDLIKTNSKKIRPGRGIGSGKGKTGGRGIKGQKSRSGVAINAYEGGQMPLYMRLPKRGFNNPNPKKYAEINVGSIQTFIDKGRIDGKSEITEEVLVNLGIIRRKWDGVRLLGKGNLKTKINISITGISKKAQDAIEKLGGKVTLL